MSSANKDERYIDSLLKSIVPNANVSWHDAVLAIDAAKLAVNNPKQANEIKAALKFKFALQQVVKAQTDPNISRNDFQALAENDFFKLKYEIADINPLLLFDYLEAVGQPNGLLQSQDKNPKTVSYDFLQRYREDVIDKCIENHVAAETLNQAGAKLKNIIVESMVVEIAAMMRDDRVSLKKRQEDIRNFISQWRSSTDDIELIAKLGNKLLQEKDLENFFSRGGMSMFAFHKTNQVDEIIDKLKDKIIELAISQNNEKYFQQLVAPGTDVNKLLHYPETKQLSTFEKKAIIFMAERGFNLPKDASAASKKYYREAMNQSPFKPQQAAP